MWVKFLKTYDWFPDEFKKTRRSFVRYKSGMVIFVTRACATEAMAAGAAERAAKPRTEIEDGIG
jgi:hypothetical protein